MPLDRTWYNSLIDDDGSNTVGSPWDKADVDALMDAVDVALVDTTPASRTDTGTVNNWAPGLNGHTFTRWSGTSDLTVTGIAGGTLGQRWTFRNGGTKVAYFVHQSGSSSVGNQFSNAATSGATPVAPGGWGVWEFNGSNWVLVGHEQGDWITPTFNAAHFAGSASQTWTLTSGDRTGMAWRLHGKTVEVTFALDTTSVGGTPSTDLLLTNGAWGGFTSAGLATGAMGYATDNGTNVSSVWFVSAAGSNIRVLKHGFGNWTASTNNTLVYGSARFAVQ